MTTATLFSPFRLGSCTLSNRIVLAPLTRGRATEDHIPTEIMKTYYTERSDAGLLITDATGISRQGLGWYRSPGIWNNEQINAWSKIVDSVHANNGVIACQLWHLGRQAHSDVTGQQIVSSSSVALQGETTAVKGIKKPYEKPKALSPYEINQTVEDYANAAVNAMKAGFDLIEVHAANGYLIDQFLQKSCNKRTDKYGGSIDNRMLFLKEVIERILSKGVNSGRIGVRLSPNGAYGAMGGSDNIQLFTKVIEWLTRTNVGYIHLLDGLDGVGFMPFHGLTKPFTLKMGRDIIDGVNGRKDRTALMGNQGYTKETAENAIRKGYGDLIAFGRVFMSNPDLVYRFKNDIELAAIADYKYWFGWNLNEEGYTDWKMIRAKL